MNVYTMYQPILYNSRPELINGLTFIQTGTIVIYHQTAGLADLSSVKEYASHSRRCNNDNTTSGHTDI